MAKPSYSAELLAAVAKVTTKRGKILVKHILKHGSVSTEDLETIYGLTDAASAARDVKDAGVPLPSIRSKRKNGRQMAIYSFGDPSLIRGDRFQGRKAFSKGFKNTLIEKCGAKCALCSTPYEPRYLQLDHRVPYQIAGEEAEGQRDLDEYMLLCGSCQRSKSWSCEHCENWREVRQPAICKTCYWAVPEDYTHIALKDHRRLEIVWLGADEVMDHARLKSMAAKNAMALPLYAKAALAEYVRRQQRK
ncbi:MAG: helix-hairpin-helix domain-containing protein [Planctomycetes bacterium]|nr:helix-hairpin-helix domain-containing protein [Planctomycetota bacterium]